MQRATFAVRTTGSALIGAASAIVLACGNADPHAVVPASDDAATEHADAPSEDAGADNGSRPEAGICPAAIFSEDFETYPAGAELAPIWRLGVEGPNSSARINLDAEGHGSAGSNRYVLFSNNGSEPDSVQISAMTPAFDVRGCGAVVLTMSVIVSASSRPRTITLSSKCAATAATGCPCTCRSRRRTSRP